MEQQQGHAPRVRARNAGLARLRRATRVTIVGATALAGAFAALAAHSFPGHRTGAAVAARRTTRTQATQNGTESDDQAQTQVTASTTAVAPPAATTAAPIVTSGAT